MLNRALSALSTILVRVTGRALGQSREATCLRSHSRGMAELEFDLTAPDPNLQSSSLRSSQLEVIPDFLQAPPGQWV